MGLFWYWCAVVRRGARWCAKSESMGGTRLDGVRRRPMLRGGRDTGCKPVPRKKTQPGAAVPHEVGTVRAVIYPYRARCAPGVCWRAARKPEVGKMVGKVREKN